MKIKFLTLTAAFVSFGMMAQAQKTQIRGGVNLANVSVTDNGRVDKANQLTSFQVGILTDIPLGSNVLTLQPGLLYTGKGSKVQKGTSGQAGYFKQTFNPQYLELPVNLLFKAPIGGTSRLFVGAGPYVAMGIGGKTKTEGTRALTGSYSYERDITFSNDDPTTFNEEEGTGLGVIRRFDYGLNGTAGIEGKSVVLGVNYGLGLAKLQSGTNSNADNNNKNRVLSLTLGFKF
ncbi:outer membrane beta-barrel protein [Flavisolibacter nicotianae]|uniref:outer membrane beta-barrel protein n=1 Tax=Flavisolibacter nicotianae TaxID=2364882 RepID=UPI000EACFDC7|nr:outer membrane beta-barrel protein [Flavisolibacter nicotianae]